MSAANASIARNEGILRRRAMKDPPERELKISNLAVKGLGGERKLA
jgi:hypothetical protein